MKAVSSAAGHHSRADLLVRGTLVLSATGLFFTLPRAAPSTNSSQHASPAQPASVPPSAEQIAELKSKADAGDAVAQMKLGQAADLGPAGKVLLAVQLRKDSSENYSKPLELCQAGAANYSP